MAQLNTNLRILSQAYSNGKLTQDQYFALRSKQLSAIEFGKPFPPMPPGLSSVNIPSVKIEAPSEGGAGTSKKTFIVIAAAIFGVLLIGLIAFMAMQSGGDDIDTQSNVDASISGQAKRLVNANNLSSEDIQLFTNNWKALGEQQQKLHRKAAWFNLLQTKVNSSIKALSSSQETEVADLGREAQLKSWKLLNRLLSPAPANIQPKTINATATPQPVISTTEQESLLGEALNLAPEVLSEPSIAPVTIPATESIPTPAEKPVVEPVVEPISAPIAAPVTAPVVEPTLIPVAEPAQAPVVAPVQATPPPSTRSGVDLNPEYEREQEFGKSARDALFSDTPEY